MNAFGMTVVAKDKLGFHYINHTVVAHSLEEADELILSHYQGSQEEFIEFDQAVLLDGIYADGQPKIIETMGKIYFDNV